MRVNHTLLLNLLVAAQGAVFLTSGAHRQRFFFLFSEFTPGEDNDQKLGETLIIVTSLMMMSILVSQNLLLRMGAIVVAAMYTCLCNSLAVFHSPQDIAIFVAEMVVIGCALVSNIDSSLAAQSRQSRLQFQGTQKVKQTQ